MTRIEHWRPLSKDANRAALGVTGTFCGGVTASQRDLLVPCWHDGKVGPAHTLPSASMTPTLLPYHNDVQLYCASSSEISLLLAVERARWGSLWQVYWATRFWMWTASYRTRRAVQCRRYLQKRGSRLSGTLKAKCFKCAPSSA